MGMTGLPVLAIPPVLQDHPQHLRIRQHTFEIRPSQFDTRQLWSFVKNNHSILTRTTSSQKPIVWQFCPKMVFVSVLDHGVAHSFAHDLL